MTDPKQIAELRATDPMERILEEALRYAGVEFAQEPDTEHGLDFHLWQSGIAIEVKQLHSPRIAAQMARAPNVIAAQGKPAVKWLAGLLYDNAVLKRELSLTSDALLASAERERGFEIEIASLERAIEVLKERAASSAEREVRYREALANIFEHYSDRDQAPGHSHDVPGIWDDDNAPGVAGTDCDWCAKWERARDILAEPVEGEGR